MSAGARYRHLFTPLRLGPVTVANRIVFSAHLTNYATDGLPTEQHAAYYAARAAGGAGLIITEEHSTHRDRLALREAHPRLQPRGHPRATGASPTRVHAHGVPILAQINHNGGQASSMYSRLPVWAPSPVPDPLFREVPKAVEAHEIAEIVDGYARWPTTAWRAASTASSCSAPTPRSCGGSSRRPPTDAPTATAGPWPTGPDCCWRSSTRCAATIGPDRALGVRLCGDELIEGGTGIDDAVEVARLVEATGQVDYINTSIGVATATLYMIEASMQIPPGYAMFIPSAIRQAVALPVVGVGRFKDPLQADRALRDGLCDLVGVVRGQIADPDFAAKARSGHATDIRTCLSCNQECVGPHGPQPLAGLHREPPDRARGRRPSRPRPGAGAVVVVGGGPGGLQAAVTAAERGHRVDPVRAPRPPRRAGRGGGHRAQPGRVPRHHPQPRRGRPPAGGRPAHRGRGHAGPTCAAERPTW